MVRTTPLYLKHYVHPFDDVPEHDMIAVEPGARGSGEVKLGGVRVLAWGWGGVGGV